MLDELARLRPVSLKKGRDAFRFGFRGAPESLAQLRTVVAVYRLLHFDIPRPRALLGDQHLRRLLDGVTEEASSGGFTSFRFGAAGSDSEVFQRLGSSLRSLTRLRFDPEEGDLLIRVRRARSGEGWEVLLRITPRPLSARAWRVCNLEGGLNATAAAAVNALLGNRPGDRYLNAMCGSGTLLIERRLAGAAARLVGCDLSRRALDCCRRNLAAAGIGEAELVEADVSELPFPDASFDALAADLPWGDAVGRFGSLPDLYPAFLAEMRRLAAAGAGLVVVSHDLKRFEAILERQRWWMLERQVQIYHGGHHPRIYLLTPV